MASPPPEQKASALVDTVQQSVLDEALGQDTVFASNVPDRTTLHQQILLDPALDAKASERKRSRPPGVAGASSGWLMMQRSSGKWKRQWCEYADGVFSHRDEQAVKLPQTAFRVSFCESETTLSEMSGSLISRYEEKYWTHLEQTDALFTFKVFSPVRMFLLRADNAAERAVFVNAIRKDLQSWMLPMRWQEKLAAVQTINPLLREQFILQVERQDSLIRSLSRAGFMEDELPITSTKKEKSGVLGMLQEPQSPNEPENWRDFYFVLFEGQLFYYKDSKSTTPTGFVTLKYASVQLDAARLAKGEFTFIVRTPLRVVVCRAKHAVALSEWFSCLENALNAHMKRKAYGRNSLRVLQDINKLASKVSSFQSILGNPTAVQYFRDYLAEHKLAAVQDLELYLAVEAIKQESATSVRFSDMVQRIQFRFFIEDSKEYVKDIPPSLLDRLEAKWRDPKPNMFDDVCTHLHPRLHVAFLPFKDTDEYKSMMALQDKNGMNAERQINPIDASMDQFFLLKVKGTKRSREIKFARKQSVLTIGRDKSNNLVIEDSRVSRSHARVEYTDSQCEYIDLGSSCGSKLNGKPVLRAKLQKGDVVEIGQSCLIYTLRKAQGAFSFLGLGFR